jgi:hypothetical protein
MTFTAKNRHGEISRPFKLVVGEKLALTPPTGWNSWGSHMIHVSDAGMVGGGRFLLEPGQPAEHTPELKCPHERHASKPAFNGA